MENKRIVKEMMESGASASTLEELRAIADRKEMNYEEKKKVKLVEEFEREDED